MVYLRRFESYVSSSYYLSDIISLDEYNFSYKDSVFITENNLFIQIVDSIIKKFKSELSIFSDINIFWSDEINGRGELSYYVRTSFLDGGPIVILFESGFNKILDNYKSDVSNYKKKSYELLERRIYDSLCHAICDLDSYYIFGMDRILKYSNEEDFVGRFVSNMSKGIVLDSVKKLCDLYCSKSWIAKDYSYGKTW